MSDSAKRVYAAGVDSGLSVMRGEVDAAPIYDDAGVDVSLVCWMLSLSPAERLEALESFTEDIMILRDAAKAP